MTKIYFEEELSNEDFIAINNVSKEKTSYPFTTLIGMLIMTREGGENMLQTHFEHIGADPKKIEKLTKEILDLRNTPRVYRWLTFQPSHFPLSNRYFSIDTAQIGSGR